MQTQAILFDEMQGTGGDVGIITLNRPEVLNSLNHHMIIKLHKQLEKWANAKQLKAVVIRASEGRAFCAGSDLRHMYERFHQHDLTLAKFFYDEYQLNRFIFHFPKPYIALLDGITMGGGVGISQHGSHRVATERLIFAMPETAIGFFPDVGGTYFLPRISHHMGYYLGLTGARIKADDSVAIGIATHKIMHEKLFEVIDAIANQGFGANAKQSVTNILNQFQTKVEDSELLHHQVQIETCFSGKTIEEILQALRIDASPFAEHAIAELNKKSPTSLKITLRALQTGSLLDFDACMRQEFRLVSHFLQEHDFQEGVRALIIDKDQRPHWHPDKLAEVSAASIERYFTPVHEELC